MKKIKTSTLFFITLFSLILPLTASAQWTGSGSTIYYNGKVGIGTATPGGPLHIIGPTTAYPNDRALLINADGESSSFRDQVLLSSSAPSGYGIAFAGQGHHRGGIYAKNAGGATDGIGEITIWSRNNGNILLNGGKIGIATTNPQVTLAVGSDTFGLQKGNGSPNAGYLRFGDNTGWKFHIGRAKESVGAGVNTSTTGAIMTILDKGKVGIGTITPNNTLEIKGTFMLRDTLDNNPLLYSAKRTITGYAGGSPHEKDVLVLQTPYETENKTVAQYDLAFASPEIWGTEASYLYSFGLKNVRLGIANDGWRRSEIELYNNNTSQGKILFRTGVWQDAKNIPASPSNVRMLIDHNGNIGIGTTAPTEKLEVAGNIKTTGSITFVGSGNIMSDGNICIGNCTNL